MSGSAKHQTQDRKNIANLKILNDFLVKNKTKNKNGMGLAMIQGFFYATVSAPCILMPGDWLFVIFGGIPTFQTLEEQHAVYMAAIALHADVQKQLATQNKAHLKIWLDGGKLQGLAEVSDSVIVDFCSGYVKGYLLDPILQKTCLQIPDPAFAFIMSLIKIGSVNTAAAKDNANKKSNIDENIRKTLQIFLLDVYLNWAEFHKLCLFKSYLN